MSDSHWGLNSCNCALDPLGQGNYTFPLQSCGGQYDAVTGQPQGFVQNSTGQVFHNPKGYLCPQGQLCMVCTYLSHLSLRSNVDVYPRCIFDAHCIHHQETGNPNNGTQNFDNVAGAAMQVIVIASGT